MASIDALLPGFLPNVPDCPDPTAAFWLREAVIAFCERTEAWRTQVSVNVNAAGYADITTSLPVDSSLVSMLGVTCDGTQLEAMSESDLDAEYYGWRTGALTGAPSMFSQTTFDNIVIIPATGATQAVDVILTLKPQIDAATIPDFIVNHFKETVMMGAKARLLAIPNKPWTDLNLSIALQEQFNQACSKAKFTVKKGQQKGRLRTKGTFF